MLQPVSGFLFFSIVGMKEITNKRILGTIHFFSFVVLMIIILILSQFSFLFWLFMMLLIFIYIFSSWKDESLINLKMIWNRRKEKIRQIYFWLLCVVLVIPSLLLRWTRISQNEHTEEARKQAEYQKKYDAAPDVSIILKSWTGHLGAQTGYMLLAQIQGEDEVRVNDNLVKIENWELEYPIELRNVETQVVINAKNEYKSATESFLITRDKTAEEIQQEKEKEEKRVEEQISQLNSYIDELNGGFDFYDLGSINQTVQRMWSINDVLWSYLQDKDSRVWQKTKELQKKLVATQNKTYPKLRNKRCGLTKDTMWRLDVEVKCQGTKIVFIWYHFARNANVQDSYEAISNMLHKLRFKRAEFRWSASSYADYQYYTIDSLKDSDL